MSRRRLLIFGCAGALALVTPAAFAATITTGSTHLGATAIAVPLLYPNSLTLANGSSNAGKLEANDVLTVVFSEELQAASLCAGAPTQTSPPLTGPVNITVTNNAGAGGYDLLTVDPVSTSICTDGLLHFGSLNLGSVGYVTSATATFTNSTMTLTQTLTSATLTLKLGSPAGTLAKVSSGLKAMYTPDVALKDVALHGIGVNTAVTSTSVQF